MTTDVIIFSLGTDIIIFLLGCGLGVAVRQIILEKEHPFKWACPKEDCSFEASSNSKEVLYRARLGHEEKHWSERDALRSYPHSPPDEGWWI